MNEGKSVLGVIRKHKGKYFQKHGVNPTRLFIGKHLAGIIATEIASITKLRITGIDGKTFEGMQIHVMRTGHPDHIDMA